MLCGFLIHYATCQVAYYNDICTPCQYGWIIKYTFSKPVSNNAGGVHVNVTRRCVRVTCCRGQAVSNNYSEYVSLDVVAQHAKCMSRILSYSTCLSTINFHVVSYTAHFRKKKVAERKICVLIFSAIFARKISFLIRTERYVIINLTRSSCKVSVNLVRF